MFGFLKEKLKQAVDVFTKKVEDEAEVEDILPDKKEPTEKKPEKIIEKDVFSEEEEEPEESFDEEKDSEHSDDRSEPEREKVIDEKKETVHSKKDKGNISEKKHIKKETKEKKQERTIIQEKVNTSLKKEETEEKQPTEKEKKGFFSKITDTFTKLTLSNKKFEELFWELELAMLENNVAVEVIEKIKGDLRKSLVNQKLSKKGLEQTIESTLKSSIEHLFIDVDKPLMKRVDEKTPYVIAMIGINGSGKTTTLAKLITKFKKEKKSVVVGACDTFRAAAIQQLQEHTDRLGVKLIKQDYGSDPAAVAYDTVAHAKAKGINIVLLDTAGRLHSNKNLMDELKKLVRVVNPDYKIFVGESITGNDCIEQVKIFNELVGVDAIVLSKADIDEKGGAAVSVSYVTKKPILYFGVGQEYEDLEEFNKEKVMKNLGFTY